MKKFGRDIAYWITKVTDTHPEYVILIAFSQQRWLRDRASMLRLYVKLPLAVFAPAFIEAPCSPKPPALQWVLWTHFPCVLGPSRETDSSSSRGPSLILMSRNIDLKARKIF